MVMAGFDPGHVKAYFPSLLNVASGCAAAGAAARARRAIDLQADLMRYTVDAIAGLAFGTDVNTLESDEDVIQRHLDKIFPALFGAPWRRFRTGATARCRPTARWSAACAGQGGDRRLHRRSARQRLRDDPSCAARRATCSKR